MTARPYPAGTPLTPEHARLFDELLATLTAEEALWISGYLAGFGRHAMPATEPAPSPPVEEGAPLLILYGSETGHAQGLAEQAEEAARARGLPVRRVDMADFKARELGDVRYLLLITSTYGDGDPPVNAMDFYEFLHGRKAPRLEAMKFAVLGLGDSSYERFCQTGKDFDERLAALGASRIGERLDADLDFEHAASEWIVLTLSAFAGEMRGRGVTASVSTRPGLTSPTVVAEQGYGQKHPFPAVVLENLVLNGRGSDKETRHIELSLTGSGLSWEPGDALGVVPENDSVLVDELLAALGLAGDDALPGPEGGEIPLSKALLDHYEITTLTPRFIELYAAASGAKKLRRLAEPGRQAELRAYMAGRQIIDVVAEYPVSGLSGPALAAMLRPLQPRLYSLASSLAAYPDEAHLTVAAVRYESHGRQRRGVASRYLERLGGDDTIPIYISANKNFRLPVDPSTALIMIGAGTGVAPFRAFLQEREAIGAAGRNWLFFGDRRFRTDFLYQTEWQRLIKDGRLSRMDVAFSREQSNKVYVQHRLRAAGKELFAWLEEGAHLYVCGDASRMAPDVQAALVEIVAEQGAMAPDRAAEYVKQLQRDKRYQRDVY